MSVFISYETTTGLSYASNLKKALGKVDISAFVADEDIPKGTPWSNVIDEAINSCTYFVVVMTIVAIGSDEIKREIELANHLHRNIIPCKPRTVDRFFASILPVVSKLQQVDFDDKEDLADQVVTAILRREREKAVGRISFEEAAETELSNIQSAVIAIMVDNNLTSLPNPVIVATNDMSAFPDISVCGINKIQDPTGNAYVAGADKDGYLLYSHDITADADNKTLVNYVTTRYTKGTYIVDARGTVTQVTTGY